ncbi:MAG: transporter substrate-binding domain-containing protein [Cyanobacteria bacterium J06588_5]
MKQQENRWLKLARQAALKSVVLSVSSALIGPLVVSSALTIGPAHAQNEEVNEAETSEVLSGTAPAGLSGTVKVGTKEIVPFVFLDEQVPYGYSIEVWNTIASDLDIETQWVRYDSVPEMLADVEAGTVDLAMAGISITAEREAQGLDFSYPFYRSGLQLMLRSPEANPIRSALSGLFSWNLWRPLLLVIGTSAGVGATIWALEHKHNDNFSSHPLNGIGQGIWFSVVTLGTFGYGDVTPTRLPARLVACLWMGASFFIVADFIAGLTVGQMANMEMSFDDLRGEPVAVLAGTTAEEYVRSQPVEVVTFDGIEDATTALTSGEVEAVVHDYPTLKYIASREPDQFELAGSPLTREDYGIAFKEDSATTELINQEILALQEGGYLQLLSQKWFGETQSDQ